LKNIEETIQWYRDKKALYEMLSNKVANIIIENLEQRDINYHSVTFRAKDIDSFARKAKNDKYSDPENEIKDMSGIRIITYLESEVNKIATIIEGLFEIDKANSLDQSSLLGSNKVGYRSVHYVAKLDNVRCQLPEYKLYKDLSFEIQVRSLLQHAWAEIEHDRSYKFAGKLPTEIHRRFYLVAGLLEVADREFVSISEKIDDYRSLVKEEIQKEELDLELNTISLNEYILRKFSELVNQGLLVTVDDSELMNLVIEELQLFDIKTISQLDKIIPNNYQKDILDMKLHNNSAGLIRDILVIYDVDKYFKISWRKSWKVIDNDTYVLWEKYGVDIDKYIEEYELTRINS
jgi:putative GTP pyrophosphokinase